MSAISKVNQAWNSVLAEINNMLKEVGSAYEKENKTEEEIEVIEAKVAQSCVDLEDLAFLRGVLSDMEQKISDTTPVMAPLPIEAVVEEDEEDPDDNNLHAWMRKRGFEVHTDALMSLGVETADDLSLVTHEDLTDLKIDDETATKISLEIAKLET